MRLERKERGKNDKAHTTNDQLLAWAARVGIPTSAQADSIRGAKLSERYILQLRALAVQALPKDIQKGSEEMSKKLIVNETLVWVVVDTAWQGETTTRALISVHLTRTEAERIEDTLEKEGKNAFLDVMPAVIRILEGTGE